MDRNLLGFRVRAENDLFLVWGSIYLVLVLVEIDLVFVCGQEIIWFE